MDRVLVGSPAYRAGVLPADELVEVSGQRVAALTADQLTGVLSKPDARGNVAVRIRREGPEATLQVRAVKVRDLIESDPDTEIPKRLPGEPRDEYLLGIRALYADNLGRAIVADVVYPSPGFDAGLHRGDSLLSVNGRPVAQLTRQELGDLLAPAGPSKITLVVSRLGRTLTFTITAVTTGQSLAVIGRKLTERGAVPKTCP